MNKFNRLKIETYDKEISGDNWPVAFFGYDSNIGKKMAVVTDHVRASECRGTASEYAQLFKTASELFGAIEDILHEYFYGRINIADDEITKEKWDKLEQLVKKIKEDN